MVIDYFQNGFVFWSALIVGNILMYFVTILISFLWSKAHHHKTLKITNRDIKNSLVVLSVNILVAIPGYWFFRKGMISFSAQSFWIHLISLYFAFDLVMYVLHFLAHQLWPFKRFHVRHHSHQYFNAISLYVMEPVESILFGLLLTVCALVFDLNIHSFLAFITINWILGVIGHLNTESTKQPRFLGNHVFHKTHHEHAGSNYGFYTVIWDRLFGTFYGD